MLNTILTIREFEDQAAIRFADNEIPGFTHLCQGQEAVAAGVCQALEDRDYISSNHRGHGHCIAKGMDPDRVMAELYGKETGYSKGHGGSMHMASKEDGVLGTTGIVSGGVSVAAGGALSAQLRGTDQVAVAFFGEGGLGQGSFHEAANLAGVWDLPLVSVIENNHYAETTGKEYHLPEESLDDLSVYGESYGAHCTQVDGMDVEAVYRAATEAVERGRAGEGQSLIECVTYRLVGHHSGHDDYYRSDEEVEEWRKKDPVTTYPEQLVEEGVVTENEVAEIHEEIKDEMQEAVEFARDSPLPDPEAAYELTFMEDRR